MLEDQGIITLTAERGGTVEEVTSFLSDLETAYIALYWMDKISHHLPKFPLDYLHFLYFPFAPLGVPGQARLVTEDVPPRDRLVMTRVRIESPGFWEFLGALNPLQQIREYLNDRHKRRQDREFREAAEKERLELENELLRRQIYETENAALRERIEILRKLGYSDEDIDRMIWSSVGVPLSRLGKHQDTGLISKGHDDN